MLKIQQKADRGAIMLTVSGRLDAENVRNCASLLDAIQSTRDRCAGLQDLVLADRAVVRLLREFEERKRIVLRNCPSYIRIWMAAEDIQ